jgi:hypothetical protein
MRFPFDRLTQDGGVLSGFWVLRGEWVCGGLCESGARGYAFKHMSPGLESQE